MESVLNVEVQYEIPLAVVEEELFLKFAPLPTKVPVHVVETQLKKYIFKHFSESPADTTIVDNSAYFKFDKPEGMKRNIIVKNLH